MLLSWVLGKALESPLDFKKIKSVNPEGNQSWIFIRRTDAEAEAPILWPPDVKSQLLSKDPGAGKDWRQEEKGMTDGWMASPTQWTWVRASSGRWWRPGKPGVLQSMVSQSVRHDWVAEQEEAKSRLGKKEHILEGRGQDTAWQARTQPGSPGLWRPSTGEGRWAHLQM